MWAPAGIKLVLLVNVDHYNTYISYRNENVVLFSHSTQKDCKYIISFMVNYFYASSLRHAMFSTEKKIFTL